MITTMEAKNALGINATTDEFFDLIDAAENNLLKGSHVNPLVDQLIAYIKKRQIGRIVRENALDSNFEPTGRIRDGDDTYFIYYENILSSEIHKFDRILYPDYQGLAEDHFERLLEGSVEFLYPKNHPANQDRLFLADPNNFFINWADYPELHEHRVLAFDSSGSPVDQRASSYLL